ncbi:MAG: hypothetical protein AAF125_15160 [Chloroflexota bacterium]
MSVRVEWLDTQQDILHFIFEGKWNWDEFYQTRDVSRTMIREVTHSVYVVLDFSDANVQLPKNLISNFRRLAENRLSNTEQFYIISRRSTLAKTLINVVGRISQGKIPVVFVESMDNVKQLVRPAR